MKKILCFVTLNSLLIGLLVAQIGCASRPSSEDQVMEKAVTKTEPISNGPPGPACAKMGTPINFNDQRIVAFQKLVQLQILRIKALPMTEESTQELSQVESIRRRASYPLLTSRLRPVVVTKILSREAKQFSTFLEGRRKSDPQAQSLYEEINEHFLPTLELEEVWNCVEKNTDFQEDMEKSEKSE